MGLLGSEREAVQLFPPSESNCNGLGNREYDRRDPLRWPRDTLYPQKLALRRQAEVALYSSLAD
jgi:hypothetical protein